MNELVKNEFLILFSIVRRQHTARQVAEKLGMSEFAAHRALRKLHSLGYVRRETAATTTFWDASLSGVTTLRKIWIALGDAIDE